MRHAPQAQRGVTLFGLLFWGVFLAFTAVVGAKVTPTVMEFYTIKTKINKIASSNPPTVAAARIAFQKEKDVEYSIQIDPADLEITKENDKVKIAFAYERTIELGGPVFLLIKYKGQSQ